jgi:hypothetical protein
MAALELALAILPLARLLCGLTGRSEMMRGRSGMRGWKTAAAHWQAPGNSSVRTFSDRRRHASETTLAVDPSDSLRPGKA